MDINSMPAGRELDELVAKKVMGLQAHEWSYKTCGSGSGGNFNCLKCGHSCASPPWTMDQLPKICGQGMTSYSTDIAAAWEMVEKMKPVWGRFRLSFGPFLAGKDGVKDGWELEPTRGSPVCGYGETAPLAICRAAIKART